MDTKSDKESAKALPAPVESDIDVGDTMEVKEGDKLKRNVSPHMVHVSNQANGPREMANTNGE